MNSGNIINQGDIFNSGNITTQQILVEAVNLPYSVPPLLVMNDGNKLLQLNKDGILRSRTIMVDVYNWPDYVFEKQYELSSLASVKSYIEQNGHLPGVPSAIEVEEDGVDVGEMNKILLEKIEEMTLHLIEQEERLKKLEEMISEQNH
tara:strand:- start:652 stop:1095 length:444 start_codon:yes stop_codon:yes gene_type:complete